MDDADNDGHLHLVRVCEDQGIWSTVPAGVQTKGIGVAIEGANSSVDRHVPTGMEEMKRLGEDVVINESGVDGEGAHEEDNIAATIGKRIKPPDARSDPTCNLQEEHPKYLAFWGE